MNKQNCFLIQSIYIYLCANSVRSILHVIFPSTLTCRFDIASAHCIVHLPRTGWDSATPIFTFPTFPTSILPWTLSLSHDDFLLLHGHVEMGPLPLGRIRRVYLLTSRDGEVTTYYFGFSLDRR